MAATYEFQAYDILQSQRPDGSWVDFGTIRSSQDAAHAENLVWLGAWDGVVKAFRIVRNVVGQGKVVVWS